MTTGRGRAATLVVLASAAIAIASCDATDVVVAGPSGTPETSEPSATPAPGRSAPEGEPTAPPTSDEEAEAQMLDYLLSVIRDDVFVRSEDYDIAPVEPLMFPALDETTFMSIPEEVEGLGLAVLHVEGDAAATVRVIQGPPSMLRPYEDELAKGSSGPSYGQSVGDVTVHWFRVGSDWSSIVVLENHLAILAGDDLDALADITAAWVHAATGTLARLDTSALSDLASIEDIPPSIVAGFPGPDPVDELTALRISSSSFLNSQLSDHVTIHEKNAVAMGAAVLVDSRGDAVATVIGVRGGADVRRELVGYLRATADDPDVVPLEQEEVLGFTTTAAGRTFVALEVDDRAYYFATTDADAAEDITAALIEGGA